MPIDNRTKTSGSGLQRDGKIRLGIQVPDGKGGMRPQRTNHFVLTDASRVAAAYGKEPVMLQCALAGRTVNECLRAFYERYTAGGALLCQGTGTNIHWQFSRSNKATVVRDGRVCAEYEDDDGTQYRPGDIALCGGPDALMYPRCSDCRLQTVLQFFVLNPNDDTRFVGNRWGYYEVSTGSGRAHDHITETLSLMHAAAQAAGRNLFCVRFTLELAEIKSSITNKEGERIRVSQRTLRFTPSEAWTEFVSAYMLRSAEGALLTGAPEVPALPEYSEPSYEEEMPPALLEMIEQLREAAKTPPPTLEHAKRIIADITGELDWNAVIWLAREAAGLAPTDAIAWPGFYTFYIEGAIAVLQGDTDI